jgi:hypothetical protein
MMRPCPGIVVRTPYWILIELLGCNEEAKMMQIYAHH